jgi:hypothetical protein
MVGRTVAVHHASPYLRSPAAFGRDAFVTLVARGFRHTTTPYGPLFVVHAAFVAAVAGTHPLLYRLAFQVSAAAAVAVALLVVWRATRSTIALVLLGLHPVVVCAVVNGGNNDAFVGLALLLAVVDVRNERYGRAGWWITAAILVKVTAGLALLPIIGWVAIRGSAGAVRRVVTAPLLVGVPVLLFTPGLVCSLGHGQIGVISRSSIWSVALRLPAALDPRLPHVPGAILGRLACVVVIVVAACVARVLRDQRDPAPGVVAAVAAWLVFGGYVLPWYTIWVLPAAVLLPFEGITWVVAAQGAAITAAFLIPRPTLAAGGFVSDVVVYAIPIGVAAAYVWVLFAPHRFRGRGQGSVVGRLNHALEPGGS